MPYCKNCGNEAEPDAEYCRRCGYRLGEVPFGEKLGREISDGIGREISDGIGREIGDSIRKSIIIESIPEIKLIDAIFGGLVVILIGGALYLAASGIVPWVGWGNFWAYFLLGLGALLLAKGAAEFLIRPARSKAFGDLQGGLIVAIVGGTFVFLLAGGDWLKYWPIFLVLIGLVIIFGAFGTYAMRDKWKF